MSRLLIVILLGWLAVFPAMAADTPQNEIVYRANLGRADDVEMLIKKGASPDGKDDKGVPLIALAAARKDKESINVIQVLLDAGAHIDARDSQGQTALFYAVKQGNKKSVDYLLSKGADYYAMDSSDNTARNLAYTTGHKDIGADIDNFIKEQSAERAKQYGEWGKPPEPLPVSQPTPLAKPTETESPGADAPVVLTPEEQAAKDAAEKKRQDDIKKLASDLSFSNCAFQYWSYVSDIGQSTELSPDALVDAIDTYKDKIETSDDQLMKDYQKSVYFINRIAASAKQRMFNELSAMLSNSNRHELGVGKESDMETRCHLIARRWDEQAPPPPPPPKKDTGSMSPYKSNPKSGMR